MKKASKIWLWIALVLCVCTTCLNLSEGRWLSVAIAVVSIAGLCLLLFRQQKLGFLIMCVCALGSFVVGSVQNFADLGAVSILMSFIGSALVPGITGLFIKSQWNELN